MNIPDSDSKKSPEQRRLIILDNNYTTNQISYKVNQSPDDIYTKLSEALTRLRFEYIFPH